MSVMRRRGSRNEQSQENYFLFCFVLFCRVVSFFFLFLGDRLPGDGDGDCTIAEAEESVGRSVGLSNDVGN